MARIEQSDGEVIKGVIRQFSIEPGYPLGFCRRVARRVNELLGDPVVDGYYEIAPGEVYSHSWNERGEALLMQLHTSLMGFYKEEDCHQSNQTCMS